MVELPDPAVFADPPVFADPAVPPVPESADAPPEVPGPPEPESVGELLGVSAGEELAGDDDGLASAEGDGLCEPDLVGLAGALALAV